LKSGTSSSSSSSSYVLVIDFHNHFYPKSYLDELKSSEEKLAQVSKDYQGRVVISYEGDYNIIVGPHVDLKQRLEAIDKFGIDMEVLTLTMPGVERESRRREGRDLLGLPTTSSAK
jgi:hypothetical protein